MDGTDFNGWWTDADSLTLNSADNEASNKLGLRIAGITNSDCPTIIFAGGADIDHAQTAGEAMLVQRALTPKTRLCDFHTRACLVIAWGRVGNDCV
jgi:hypothetical protein